MVSTRKSLIFSVFNELNYVLSTANFFNLVNETVLTDCILVSSIFKFYKEVKCDVSKLINAELLAIKSSRLYKLQVLIS